MPEIKDSNCNLFSNYTFEEKLRLYNAVSELYSENKRQLFDRLVKNRTRHICVVLEDVFQSHNASAVLRSCDCFGVQDVHVIEDRNKYAPNSDVSMGSDKWVDYYKHSDIRQTYDELRAKGYRIVATLPHENDTMITDLDIRRPTALVFGTELTGLTQEAVDYADAYVKVPMYGFTESFNISVCAALSLFCLTEKMRADTSIHWQLGEEEQLVLKLYWSIQVVHDGLHVVQQLEKRLFG